MDTHGYCLRVDALDGYSDKLPLLSACSDYKSIVAVKHHGSQKENPHFHLVVRTEVASQAFRVRMRKIFDQGKGNGHMSIKPWDGNNDAVSYLFHEDENAVLLVQHNVSDETIAACRERNRQVTQMVVASKTKASWHLEEVIWDAIKDRAYDNTPGWRLLDESYIGQQLILAALRHGKYVPQPWHLKAMTQRLQFRLQNGHQESEEDFAMRLSRQIFYREH